jgi:methylated-DNA-[protein]-cysteine S-methyltransferase
MYKSIINSPIGFIEIKAGDEGITSILFLDEEETENNLLENPHIMNCIDQIKKYFNGELKVFNITLDINGTEFQKSVWNRLLQIEYGKKISYNQLAEELGDKKQVRAAANANSQNPIALIVPCHRVIGSDGSLTGYAGGLWRKKWLLDHEAKFSNVDYQIDFFE